MTWKRLARTYVLAVLALIVGAVGASVAKTLGMALLADFLPAATMGATFFYLIDRAYYGIPERGETA